MTTKVELTICWRVSLCLVALVFLGSAGLAGCTPSPPSPTAKPPTPRLTARMLTAPYALMGPGPSSFTWSPAGATVAYVEPKDSRDVLWLYDAVTGSKQLLLNPAQNSDSIDPTSAQWSPQGDALLLAGTPLEIDLQPDLFALAKAVCRRWGQPCDFQGQEFDQRVGPLLNLRLAPLSMTGPECVKVGMNCLAPTEDSAYFMSARLPLPNDRVYAVLGALGTQTGNATYVGLGLNSSLLKLGFDNISDEELAGSAEGYDVPNHSRFFLQYFARDCTGLEALTAGSLCYSIGDRLPVCYDPGDLGCAMLVLSVRNYILPGTQRGPAAELTLSPRVIVLQRP